MSEFAKLAIDFLAFQFCVMLATVVGGIIFYVVGATVEHFTP